VENLKVIRNCILLMQCGTQAGKPNFERACLLEYQIRRV